MIAGPVSAPPTIQGTTASAPIDPAQAARALAEAADREQIFALLLRATRSRVDFAALLSVHRDGFRGRQAIAGDGFDLSAVAGLTLPRDGIDAFEQAVSSRALYIGPLATGKPAIDDPLRRLGGVVPKIAVVLPVVLQGRTVALVVGHNGERPLGIAEIADLVPLVPESGRVLERVLARRADAAAARPTAQAPQAASAPVDDVAAQRRLLASLREQQSWPELADALRALLRVGVERGEPDEDEQLELLFELGRVEAERLRRPELAVEAWRSAQAINAADTRVCDALEQLLVAEARWEEVVVLLDRRAALSDEPAERVRILLELATVARERLLDDGRAIEAYERIRAVEPAHAEAAHRLEAIYRTSGSWRPLVALLLDLASHEPEGRVAALESAAEILEQQLGDARAAFLVWLTVLRREPRRPGGVEALEHLASVAAAWQELVPELEALATELEATDGAVAARLWHQIAGWKRDHLGLSDYPAALERSLAHAPDDVERLDELLELRRASGPWADLATLLARRAALELDPVRRAALYAELGTVQDARLGQPNEAVAAYESAVAADASSRAALLGLVRIHRERGAWAELASVLPLLFDVVDGDDKLALHLELGELYAERLGRPDDARRAFEDALALDAANTRALKGLAAVHRATGQTDAYLSTVEAELDAARAPAEAQRYGELATAWEERGQLERAIVCWRKLLAAHGGQDAAHAGLIGVLRKAGRWPEVVQAHRARLEVSFGMSARAQILLELAADLDERLGDADGAIAACQEVLALKIEVDPALDRMAQCLQRAGRLDEARATLEQRLERASDGRTRAGLHQRLAQLHADRGEETRALAGFTVALELDPSNAAAHEGLARLHRRKGELSQAADHLRRAGLEREHRFEAIRRLTEAAALYRDKLSDLYHAAECLHRIVELEGENLDARRDLTALYAAQRNWQALWPHAARLAEAIGHDPDASPEERRQAWLRTARCALEVGQGEAALAWIDRAVAVDPAHVPTLLERADALGRTGAHEAAIKAYQAILVQRAGALDAGQRVLAFRKLALVHKQLGNLPQTLAYLRKVLDVDAHDAETLRELVELHSGRGQLDEAVGVLRALAESAAPVEKAAILERVGDLQHDKLKNAARAEAAWSEALALDGSNRRLLQKLLDLQSESGQWKEALGTIARFLDLESDPRRRGKYFAAMAAIRRFQTREEAAAADDYERALDALLSGSDPLDEPTRTSALEVFQRLDELLVAQAAWPRQERAHRLLIKRLPPDDARLVELWHALGEINRTRLQHYETAIYAFETAHALDPHTSPERVRLLAELYALVGKEAPARATDHAARLVDADPDNPDVYRAMGRACVQAGRLDEAWCVSRALVLLKKATAEEQELYQRYQAHERAKTKGVLDEETWALLRDDAEDRVVSAIFALTWEGPVALRSGPAKSFQLKSKEKLKVEDPSRTIGKIFQTAARVLNAPLPHVYVQPERPGRLLLANCVENGVLAPAVIVGRDLMTGYRDTEIAFSVASLLALLRPAWYLRLSLPAVAELEAALAAAVGLIRGEAAARPEPAPLQASFSTEMHKRLTPETAERLRGLMERLSERPNLSRWRDGVDAAARRAGLLVCGDLEAAVRMVSTEPAPPDGPAARDKVRELVVFSVSPGYFAARRALGVTVA